MNKEEKKAVEYWKKYIRLLQYNSQIASEHYAKIILNLIYKQQKEKQKLKRKLKEIETLVDTRPYVAYTLYGDLLYEGYEILEIIRGK